MRKLNKLIVLLFAFFVSISLVNAEVVTKERTSDNKYGVNKKWTITDNNMDNVISTPYVDASEKIYDFSDILTDEEESILKEKILAFQNKWQTELIIYTDDISYTYDSINETKATDFYDYNDFGIDYEKYDGIIFFRNTYTYDPYYAMYMFGDAQLYIDEDRMNSVLDDIYYDIHGGDYLDGITSFIDRMDMYYSSGVARKHYHVDDMGFLVAEYVPPYFIATVASIIISGIIVWILVLKNEMVKKATLANEYLDKNSVHFTKKIDQFLTTHTSSYTVSSSSGGGGGGSHGGSSGGGHSGGGRHG